MRITAAGNVGIGTTNPGAKLEVASSASGTTMLVGRANGNSSIKALSDAGGYLALDSTGGGTILNHYSSDNIWLVTGGGNVGINTSSPSEKLHVSGNIRVTGAYYDSNNQAGTSGQILSSTGSGTDWVSLSEISGVDGTGTANYVAKWSDTDTITNSQLFDNGTSVGIGTNSPNASYKLTISGSTYQVGTNSKIYVDNGGIGGASAILGVVGTSYGYLNTDGAYPFVFQTNSTERMRITSAGRLGIGTTAPGYVLEVNGGSDTFVASFINSSAAQSFIRVGDTSDANYSGLALYSDSGSGQMFKNGTGSNSWGGNASLNIYNSNGSIAFHPNNTANAMFIATSGNIGMGTTNPLGPLEVYRSAPGSLGGYIVINNDGSSVYNETALMFGDGGASGIRAAISTTTENSPYYGQINFKTGVGTYSSLSTRMTITGAGNVGIGTTSPSQKLTVAGRTNVDQFQYNQGIPISGTNLNDWTDAGFYAGSGLTNAPEAVGWYFVTVERHSDSSWVHQTATSYGAGNTANRVYTRVKSSGTWGAWKELADNASISGTTNYVSKFTSGNTIGNSLIYDNGTNVGIGTTGPSFKFEVIGNVSFDSGKQFTVNNGNGNSYEVYYNGGTGANSWRHIYGANGTGYGVGVGGYGIYYQGNGDYNQINFPNGNTYFGYSVGIGTNTPTAPLDTNGVRLGRNWAISNRADIRLDSNGADYPADILFGHTSAANETDWNGVYWSLSSRANALSNAFTIWRGSGNPGGTGEQVMLTILPAGNIGIGTTSPSYKLDVTGDARFGDGNNFNPLIQFAGSGRVATSPGYSFVGDLDTGMFNPNLGNTLAFSTAGSERMRITSAGNVGIGTTSPTTALEISQVAPIVTIQSSDTTQFHGIEFRNGGNLDAFIKQLPQTGEFKISNGRFNGWGGHITLYTDTAERMRITSAGDVGIGTTSPSTKLHVQGTSDTRLH